MEKFTSDFDKFWGKIKNGENFSFARYADGEVMLMKGEIVSSSTQAGLIDKWTAPLGLTKVGLELLETMNHTEPNYFYAISAPTDNLNDYNFLKSLIKTNTENITFVNLWINNNYSRTLTEFSNLIRPVNLICNEKAVAHKFPFKVESINPFPNDCITFWESSGDTYIEKLKNSISKINNGLFFISCGPVSEIIINKLYETNPNNTYIDVGSSLDEYIHGKKTRPYMITNSIYNKMISKF